MAKTHRVVITDLNTGAVVIDERVDINNDRDDNDNPDHLRSNDPFYRALPQHQWEGILAALAVAPKVCPWDCSICQDD